MLLTEISKEFILKVLIAIAFFYTGNVCSTVACNAFNSYYCGISHDLSATFWQLIGVACYVMGGIMIIIALVTAIPSNGVSFTLKNDTSTPSYSITRYMTRKIESKFDEMIDSIDVPDFSSGTNNSELDLNDTSRLSF